MANIKSAIKRIDVTKRQTLENKARKSEIKTYVKKFEDAISSDDFDEAKSLLKVIDKKLKKATSKNVLHKNTASRQLSKLSKKLNSSK
ncbi:30S ribosomal protein S20 [Miniphocaeibacter halophilus]|uniref:30S ribosomal protein S20 n=1 Tax=Miniphocaeibacter halophilus TaxID=2931922 RepID=A0AC61MTC0_9FIRM|nr:30S ribosomal protein S20 [Miniphocaeibacter halophilus]QQK07651.1 30S ribosomal protein S20 [Miniphocaeibacter halophilus]